MRLIQAPMIILAMCSLLACAPAIRPDEVVAPDWTPIQIILKFRGDIDAAAPETLERLSQAAGVRVGYVRPMSAGAHVMVLTETTNVEVAGKAIDALGALPEVEHAQIDHRKRQY